MLGSKSDLELLSEIRRLGPDMLGISVASERDVLQSASFILRLRDSKTKTIQPPLIMLGGPALSVFPELAQRTDADLLVGDADLAVELAFELLKNRLSSQKTPQPSR